MSVNFELVADCLERYAEGVAEREADDQEPHTISMRYMADVTKLRAGQMPSHHETIEALLDPGGPMALTENGREIVDFMETVPAFTKPYDYDMWVNAERTVFVRRWFNGDTEMATRPDPSATWGPPMKLKEEQ